MIKNKTEIYRQYIHSGKLQREYDALASISNILVESSKGKHYSELSNKSLHFGKNILDYSKHLLTIKSSNYPSFASK